MERQTSTFNLQLFAANDPMGNPFGTPATQADDTFEIDLTEVEGGNLYGRIPKGDYPGKLVDLKKDISSTGNPMWVWTFVITHGEYAGREFKLWTVRTPAAAWKIAETLEALGLGKSGEKPKFTKSEALNRQVILEIVDDRYNGQETSKLQRIKPHPDGPIGTAKQVASGPDPDDDMPF